MVADRLLALSLLAAFAFPAAAAGAGAGAAAEVAQPFTVQEPERKITLEGAVPLFKLR